MMNKAQKSLLRNALYRYLRFHKGEELTRAWTGLGTAAVYRPVTDAGYMEFIHGTPEPRIDGWLRLTPKGAEIVQAWIDAEGDNPGPGIGFEMWPMR